MACRPGYEDFPYVALLTPQWWTPKPPSHDEIIETARGWGPCRVRTQRKRISQQTRIYFPQESSLVMLRMVFGDRVWKLYRLVP